MMSPNPVQRRLRQSQVGLLLCKTRHEQRTYRRGVLCLHDHEVPVGAFDRLETFLQEHGVPCDAVLYEDDVP